MAGVRNILMMLAMCLTVVGGGQACLADDSVAHDHHRHGEPLAVDPQEEGGREWVREKIGDYLPLDLTFVNEKGKSVRLGDIIDRPTILLPIYFFCPDICSQSLANLAVALNRLSFQPGKDYRVIALSFNEREGHRDAAQAKRNYLKILDKGFPADEWFFLTGSREAIRAATDAVGFRFKRVDDMTFVHPAALMVIAGDGKIIRYVYGSFLAGDIDIGLSSAKSGTVSRSVRRLLAFCFNYDPQGNTSVVQIVKISILAFFGVTLLLVWLYFRSRGRRAARQADRNNGISQERQQ